METNEINKMELAKFFKSIIKLSNTGFAFATPEYFYFDSYDYKKIEKECNGCVVIETTYVKTKNVNSMCFRINIQEFYKYQALRADLNPFSKPNSPLLPSNHPENSIYKYLKIVPFIVFEGTDIKGFDLNDIANKNKLSKDFLKLIIKKSPEFLGVKNVENIELLCFSPMGEMNINNHFLEGIRKTYVQFGNI